MEGNNHHKPRGLLIFGAPCSGKTTFCEKFSKKFNIAHYDLTTLKEEHGFTREQILIILAEILKTKQTILIEGEISTEKERIEVRNTLRRFGYEPSLVWIQTDIATIRTRLKSKFKSVSKAKEFYDKAISELEAPTDEEHPIILSGKHTFETQTKHVIVGLADLSDTK